MSSCAVSDKKNDGFGRTMCNKNNLYISFSKTKGEQYVKGCIISVSMTVLHKI
jgi:hypothetical protein